MTRPLIINPKKSIKILSNHQNLVLVAMPGNADKPIVQKRQVRLANDANDDGPVVAPADERNNIVEGVIPPFGEATVLAREESEGGRRENAGVG